MPAARLSARSRRAVITERYDEKSRPPGSRLGDARLYAILQPYPKLEYEHVSTRSPYDSQKNKSPSTEVSTELGSRGR